MSRGSTRLGVVLGVLLLAALPALGHPFHVTMARAEHDPVTGARVPSCWGMGPFGLPRVKPSKEAEWAARLEKLAQVVEAYLVDYSKTWAAWAEADRPAPTLHAIELF